MSKVECLICKKSMRKDNLIRHLAVHKKDLCGLMIDSDIVNCKTKQLPIVMIGKKDEDKKLKAVVCLHCGDYNTTPYGMNAMLSTYEIKHKECKQKFKEYDQYYQTPDNELIMSLLDEPTIVGAELESLKKENDKLKEEYETLDRNYSKYMHSQEEKSKQCDNVINVVTDVLLRQLTYKLPDSLKIQLQPYINQVEAAIAAYED